MHEAYMFCLSSIMSMVSWKIISSNFDKLKEYVLGKLDNELIESSVGLKYGVMCI